MTARELADAAGVSEAAVVRFAQALGFRGFPELRAALRHEVLTRLGASAMVQGDGNAQNSARLPQGLDVIRQGFELDRSLVEATARLNSPDAFAAVARELCAARRVWVTAHGTTFPAAHYLAMKLRQILGDAETLTVGVGDLADRTFAIGPEDVLIGISLMRYFRATLDIMRVGRERSATVVAITDSPSAPAARLAAMTLLVARDAAVSHFSEVGLSAAINAILSCVTLESGPRARSVLAQYDRMVRDWRVLADDPGSDSPPEGDGNRS